MSPIYENDLNYFRVIDLKQFVYCPRIFYYQTVLPEVRPITGKMREGILVHNEEDGRERRRKLKTYGLTAGERHFHYSIRSERYHLSGEIDLLIETDEELIPIDYKNTKKPGLHFKWQLAAYGLVLQNQAPPSLQVKRGFLYLIPERKAVEVVFTSKLFKQVENGLTKMAGIRYSQFMPDPTSHRHKCVDCEFRRFCNDVL